MGWNFNQEMAKEGEDISYYEHSFESSRDSTTNLKISKWAAAVTIQAVVRSQPSMIEDKEPGVHDINYILILTNPTTVVARLDIIKWKDMYFDIVKVEKNYRKGSLIYYKAHCYRRLEWLGN